MLCICITYDSRFFQLTKLDTIFQYGAVVDETTEEGYTPLHVAAKEGHVEICETLLENGASVSLKTKVST